MRRLLATASLTAMFATGALAQGPVQYRAADNINNIPVSQATPLPVQGYGSAGSANQQGNSGPAQSNAQVVYVGGRYGAADGNPPVNPSDPVGGVDLNGNKRTLATTTTGNLLIGVIPTSTTTAAFTGSATANTFTSPLAANGARKNCTIYSASAFSVGLGANPTAATAIPVAAGGTFKCSDAATVIADQINVVSATASAVYVVWSQ